MIQTLSNQGQGHHRQRCYHSPQKHHLMNVKVIPDRGHSSSKIQIITDRDVTIRHTKNLTGYYNICYGSLLVTD